MAEKTQILAALPWAEISELVNSERFGDKFSSIPTETLEFALEEDNYQSLVEAALESIKKTEPEKANLEYAAYVADLMKKFAAQILRERKFN